MLSGRVALARLKRANARLSLLRWLLRDFSVPAMPGYVGFNVSARCNLACPHCPSHGTPEAKRAHNDPRGDMAPADFARLAAEALPYAETFALTLTGEPMGLPDLPAMLDRLAAFGAKLHLVTNGTYFNPARLRSLIPVAGTLQLSADGGTQRVFEALRLGARFPAFLHNARVLGRTLELVSDLYSPYFGLTSVIMGSNLAEMPELVRLAHFARARKIQLNGIIPSFAGHAGERLELHRARFNHYRRRALEAGRASGVFVEIFQAPFEGVVPDPRLVPQAGMLLASPPGDGDYAELPPLESYVDLDAIEGEARALAEALRAGASERDADRDSDHDEEARRLEERLDELLGRHRARLREIMAHPERDVPFCIYLQQRSHLRQDGTVLPCCIPEMGELGNALQASLGSVWNGPKRRALAERFFSDDPPAPCVGCESRRSLPVATVLRRLFPEGGAEAVLGPGDQPR